MEKILIKSSKPIYSNQIIVPVDGKVDVQENGGIEVSEECAKILTKSGNWYDPNNIIVEASPAAEPNNDSEDEELYGLMLPSEVGVLKSILLKLTKEELVAIGAENGLELSSDNSKGELVKSFTALYEEDDDSETDNGEGGDGENGGEA